MSDGLLSRALSRIVAVKPSEAGALVWSFLYFFFLLSGYYVLRPVRDAMGIVGGEKALPWLFTATFLTMLAVVPVYGAVVARVPARRIIPSTYRFFAVNLALFYLAIELGAPRVSVGKIFFVWTSVYNLFVVSIFWSFMVDLFTSEESKRLFGAIAAGGSAGAIVGPLITGVLARRLGEAHLLLLLLLSALTLEICVVCVRKLERVRGERGEGGRPLGGSIFDGFKLVLTSPYLAGICLCILCLSATATFLYLLQARLVAQATLDTAARTELFAWVDAGVNALSLTLELLLTGRVLSRLGVAVGLSALPAVTGLGFAALGIAPGLVLIAVLSGIRRAVHYAIERPAREVLFTVLPREAKYKAKPFMDTAIYRGGDAASGWGYAALAASLGAGGAALSAGLPICALWLFTCLWLAQRHRALASATSQEKPKVASTGTNAK
jgi:ATP:ADP antiporter, AAA family